MLRLKTFGGLSLWRGTDPVADASAPPCALPCLAILGLAGDRMVSEDDAIALLWPELPRDAGRAALFALRDAFPEWLGGVQPLASSADGLRLDPGVISSDVRDFEFAAASGAPDQASLLYEGPFLRGVVPPARSFDRWREREAARLAQIAKWCRDATRPRRSKTQLVAGAQIGHGGRYRIEREIGGGAAATVYLAHDARHDRAVAIKVLREDISETISPERFEREIRFVAQLQHPHVLPLFDSGELGPVLYSVMPFVNGETVRQRLDRDGKFPLEDAVLICAEVADALAYAHEHGVVHRDVKPENILLSDGHPFITDFGIARAMDSGDAGRTTLPGVVLGTMPYMSPEQATGETRIDGRTDVYAMGAVLYEMISGSPPFAGEPARRMMARRLTEVPPPVSRMGVRVPAAVDEILLRALQPVPEDRVTARSLADALAAAGRHLTGELPAQASRPNRRPAIFATIVVLALVAVLFASRCAGVGSATAATADTSLLQRILTAEDARGGGRAGVAPLIEGTASRDTSVRRAAVRALGRLQRPELGSRIANLLGDSLASIRAEAANALAQSVAGTGRGPDAPGRAVAPEAARLLEGRLSVESDAMVTGVLARSLGRLPVSDAASARAVESAILARAAAFGAGQDAPQWVSGPPAHDITEGLYALARARRTLGDPSPATVNALRAAAFSVADPGVRRIGMLALSAAGRVDSATAFRAMVDADADVRRLALSGTSALPPGARESIVRHALADPDARVRIDAVRAVRSLANPADCAPLIAATRDASTHVVLAAIDALGTAACADRGMQSGVLRSIVASLATAEPPPAGGRDAWHAPAHALVSLAQADSAAGAAALAPFAESRRPQLREYAARAAGILHNATVLLRLSTDSNFNVRATAVTRLAGVRHHRDDSVYVAALGSRGYQVVLAGAGALAGSPEPGATPALLDALDRLSLGRRENSHDPRVAVLSRVAELGHASDAARIQPYLADFDTTIAAQAARILSTWTDRPARARAQPLPIREEPLAQLFATRGLQLRITMARASGGGTIVVRLFPDEAPATVARVVRLARDHYYDGLTFHRVEPTFVIQGGSPFANEYAGDGPFMRDEVGLRSHNRGTLGISTRGRDTGDAQFFVNLVDNPRLDHDYTVFGEIISGMDVAEGVLEGDAMARVEVVRTTGNGKP